MILTIKEQAKKLPFLVIGIRALRRYLERQKKAKSMQCYSTTVPLLTTFYPNIDSPFSYPELSISAANRFPQQLLTLACLQTPSLLEISDVESFSNNSVHASLAELLDKYGSDKNSTHNYTPVYAKIFEELPKNRLDILEIGLGTNNPHLPSTMGVDGKPGASLRAFRDYLSYAFLYGADIDEGILFSGDRIVTSFVDQLDPNTFDALYKNFACTSFDLIIDDGLHSTEANINSLLFALSSLKDKGYFVIEDIEERTLPVWQLVRAFIPSERYKAMIVKARYSYLFIVNRIG